MAINANDILDYRFTAAQADMLLSLLRRHVRGVTFDEIEPLIGTIQNQTADHIRRDAEPSVEPSPE